jgi:uncharacterized membrane protein SpoIIM required for sporulation
MNSEAFIRAHRASWEQLNTLLGRMAQSGPAGLNRDELMALGPLFRQVASHLAYAQAHYPDHEMVGYLNRLVVRAHGHIYKKETLAGRRFYRFFAHEFPWLVRRYWLAVCAAGLILLLGLLTGFLVNYYQPSLNGWVLPQAAQRAIAEDLSRGRVGAEWADGDKPAISTFIMLNNIQVGLTSFALGFTWGLGTLYVLFFNGLLVGVLGAVYSSAGYALEFWTLILPHGALELAAIFICGGAGLTLAGALVKPGDYLRRDALVVQGKIAVKLVVGTIPMFAVAALIEGFITPSALPGPVKLAVAALTMAAFFVYICLGSRKTDNMGRNGNE